METTGWWWWATQTYNEEEFNKNKLVTKGLGKWRYSLSRLVTTESCDRKLYTWNHKAEGAASEPRDIAVHARKEKPVHRNPVKGAQVTNTLVLLSSHLLTSASAFHKGTELKSREKRGHLRHRSKLRHMGSGSGEKRKISSTIVKCIFGESLPFHTSH